MDDDLDQVVLEFMREYPGTARYISHTNGVYNPSTGSVGQMQVVTPVDAILMDLTLQSNGLSAKYGTLVQAGDKQAYIRPPSTNFPPVNLTINPVHDRLVFAGVEYKIVAFKELNPTGAHQILIDLYLRR